MELTNEEVEALSAYFEVTTINITQLVKKIGLKKVRLFEGIIDKTIEFDKTNKK